MSKSKNAKQNDREKRIKRVGNPSRQAGAKRALTNAARQYMGVR